MGAPRPTVPLLAALLCLGLCAPAGAATITVGTTADDATVNGNCTLREAVITANTDVAQDACTAGSGADTIALAAGTYTFALAGTGENGAATGDLDVTAPLSIAGAGAAQTVVDANDLDRVLDIIGAVAVTVTATTLTNGSAPGVQGGGVLGLSGSLRLEQAVVSENVAREGAGLSVGDVVAIDSTISGNAATQTGGGMRVWATATLTDTVISDSSGTGGGAMYGGGASAIVVTGGRLTGNSATSSGGAINTSGPLTVTGTRIDHNHSGNSGGGLFVDIRNGFPARLERVEIDSNDASAGAVTRGGGIASLGHLDIVDSWIHDNFMSSSGQGAGLDLQPRNIGGAEPITISGTTISGNAAGTQGGDAIRFGGTSDPSSATIVRSTITGNGVDAVDALGGTGGVFAGPLWTIGLSSVTIAGNRATTAGGLADNLYVFPTAVVNAANTLIANPVAGLDCVAEGPLNALGGNAEYAATRTCGFENGADAALAVPTELGTLADNGGPTPTLALTAGSPARGQGATTCEATDQRGVARPAGGPCDPGAFQYPAPAPSDGGGDGGGGGTTTTPTTPTTPPVPVVPPAAPPVTAPGQVLLCEGAKITLVDLRRSRGRVVVTGAALTSLAGKRVTITADHGGAKRTATVTRDGSFAATFPAPKSDQTSYAARYGDDRTSPLKLTRNLSVIAQRRTGTGVRIVARHSQGKRVKGQKATLRRTTGCGTQTVAGTARFDKHGRVTMTLAFPTPPDTVAVYRVTTRTNRTFTLPIVVR